MITWLRKNMFRKVAETPIPAISDADWNQFVNSPVWLILRQQTIARIDASIDMMFSATDEATRNKCIGLIQGLMFLTDTPEALKQQIVEDEDLLLQAQQMTQKLRQIIKLTEDTI